MTEFLSGLVVGGLATAWVQVITVLIRTTKREGE